MAEKRRKKWTKDEVLADSKKFKYKNLWRVKSKGAHAAAIRFGILEECYSHMTEMRNPYKSGGVVYVFEFNNNSCYVGLSGDVGKRFSAHMEDGPVYKQISTGATFKFKILEHKTHYPIETKEKEKFWATFYELNGWILLNDKKSLGALGGSVIKWSEQKVRESSLKFSSIKDWRDKEEGSYRAAIKYGILDELSIGKKKGKGKGLDNALFNKPNNLVRGSKHGNSSLCESDVISIRERLSRGEKQNVLAREYEVDPTTISNIATRKHWGWLS